jgi:5-methylthioribose kinase
VDAGLLDIEQPGALVGYLKGTGRVGEGEEPVVRVLAGGVFNRTVLVKRPEVGEAWVVKQALPKLRVAVDWFSDPERIHREARHGGGLGGFAAPQARPEDRGRHHRSRGGAG